MFRGDFACFIGSLACVNGSLAVLKSNFIETIYFWNWGKFSFSSFDVAKYVDVLYFGCRWSLWDAGCASDHLIII